MNKLILIKIAYRNIWRNLRRSVFCFCAVGITVFFIVFYQSLQDGLAKSADDIVQIFETGSVKIVSAQYEAENEYMPVQYPVADGENADSLAKRIKSIANVKEVFPRIQSYATLQESTLKHAILWGLKTEEEMKANNFNLTDRNNGLVEGRYPKIGSNECVVGRAFAQKTGLKVGDRIPLKTISAQFSDKIWSPEIVGIFNFDYLKVDERYIIVDFERLQKLLVLNEGTQQLVIFANDKKKSKAIAKEAAEMLGKDNVAQDWQDNYWVAYIKSARFIYIIVYLIFLIVASFLIINTVVMVIHERIKEIGMMGSLGMTRREIVMVFFFEAFFLSTIGAFFGVALGGLLTGIGQFFPIRGLSSGAGEFPMSTVLFLSFNPLSLLQAWLMGVGVASIFTLLPSLKSAFVEPVEALRR